MSWDFIFTPVFLRAFLAMFLISIVSAIGGTFTVFRGTAFLANGVSHAALGGAALFIFLSGVIGIWLDPLFGALIFGVLMAIITAYAGSKGETEKMEIAIGGVFALSMSIAIIFVSLIREQAAVAWGLLFGDLLLITELDLLYLLVFTMLSLVVVMLFLKEFIFISFDMEGAEAFGLNTKLFHYGILLLISLSVVAIMKGVGAILAYALITMPPAIANTFSKSPKQVMVYSFIISLIASFFGLIVTFLINISPAGVAAFTVSVIYLVTMFLSKQKEPQAV